MASSRSLGASAATALALLAAAAGYALGRHQGRPNVAALPSLAVSPDAASLAPHGTRFVLAVDLAKLRASPATAPLFERITRDTTDCRARLLARVRRAFVFARDVTLDDSAFVFETAATRDELAGCLREMRTSRPSHATIVRYRGVELSRAVDQRTPDLPPSIDATEIAALPGGLVLAGPSGAVRSMIDRAFAATNDPSDEGSIGLSPPLRALHDKLDRGYALAALALLSPLRPRWTSALEGVEGVGVGAWADDRLKIEATLSCADFDSPRAIADRISGGLRGLASEPSLSALAGLDNAVRIERRASDVRVRLEFSPNEVVTLATALRSIVDDPRQALDRDAPEDGGSRSDSARP